VGFAEGCQPEYVAECIHLFADYLNASVVLVGGGEDIEQFDLEYEGGAGRDGAHGLFAIGEI
jgi:hypothetical protein